MRLSAQHRHANETRIRAVMDRLLTGHIPTGANCDLSTLARLADTDRAAFYGNRPYAHLREEFERRLRALRDAGQTPDPHQAQTAALKQTIADLTDRPTRRDHNIADLTEFKTQALSRLAAQHEEITRLRATAAVRANLRTLPTHTNTDQPPPRQPPTRAPIIGPC